MICNEVIYRDLGTQGMRPYDNAAVTAEVYNLAGLFLYFFNRSIDQGLRIAHSADQDQSRVALSDRNRIHPGPSLQGVNATDASVDEHIQ